MPAEPTGAPGVQSYLVQEAQLLPRLGVPNLHLKEENSLFMLPGCFVGHGHGKTIEALVGLSGCHAQADIHAAGLPALPSRLWCPLPAVSPHLRPLLTKLL